MNTLAPTTERILFAVCGVLFAGPCLFFTYYTVRLIYLNINMSAEDAAVHRTGGMLIGAIAFPLAAIICGSISWFFISKARRGASKGIERQPLD